MRVKLISKNREKLFCSVLKCYGNWNSVATSQKISTRTLNDWRRGVSLIPIRVFEDFVKNSGINKSDLSPSFFPDFWHIKKAARKGAIARIKIYGNFGTPAGRRKGGLASIATHQRSLGNFRILKNIERPQYSKELAELMGILIGDGHLSKYQVSFTTNSKTDKDHALFVSKLIHRLFGILTNIKDKKKEKTVNVIASSKNLVDFLNSRGMPIGNKIQNDLNIPGWIIKDRGYLKAFVRGLFDTDGCVYVDVHKRKNKKYYYLGWTITSYADKLLRSIISALKNFGFSPTNKSTQKSVYLRRQKEIIRYFEEIGTNNPKHYWRFKNLIGRVPKWS